MCKSRKQNIKLNREVELPDPSLESRRCKHDRCITHAPSHTTALGTIDEVGEGVGRGGVVRRSGETQPHLQQQLLLAATRIVRMALSMPTTTTTLMVR